MAVGLDAKIMIKIKQSVLKGKIKMPLG